MPPTPVNTRNSERHNAYFRFMLKHLTVKNYALIDELNLEMREGLSVLTGETGAGKSIILGALGLALGKRADLKTLRNPDQKCVVEAVFALDKVRFLPFFKKHDLDFEPDCIIRREITPGGKSRTFINDTPVTLNVLNKLSNQVIDVHSQHDTLLLSNNSFQLQLLDSYADNKEEREAYSKAYSEWKSCQQGISEFEKTYSLESFDLDYQQFLFEELTEARLEAGEQERLEDELRVLESAEEIRDSLAGAINSFEESIESGIQNLLQNLRSLSRFGIDYESLLSRAESTRIELADLRGELESLTDKIEMDPAEMARKDERLSLLIRLQRKHGVVNEEDLISKRDGLGEKLDHFAHHDERLQQLKEQLTEAEKTLKQAGEKLSVSRKSAISRVEEGIHQLLRELNLPAAKLEVRLDESEFQASGMDTIEFLFTANPGQSARPLKKVASGGELSRVMLAVKAIMAARNELPAIIFDEIDTGVSGETAGKIGAILKEMSGRMQVLAITHLPQIASRGDHHYKVYKEIRDGDTRSGITLLSEDARLQELARMLSGEEITDAAIANARTLLHN